MAQILAYPSVSGDDGATDGDNFSLFVRPLLGIDGWGRYYKSFVRVILPLEKNAVILSASLSLTAKDTAGSGLIAFDIYGNASDNAVAPVNDVTFNALVKTTATVSDSIGAWVTNTQYTFTDISSIVREITTRTNWAINHAFMLMLYSKTPYGDHHERNAFGIEDGSKYAVITVEYAAPPSITSFNPVVGRIGYPVTIVGTSFIPTPSDNIVKFNGVAATVLTASTTQLTTTVPEGATTGNITVQTVYGTGTSADPFTVLINIPKISMVL
jgi:hypothetical protein